MFRPNFSISLNALFSQSQTTSATVLLHEGSIRRKIKYVTKKLAVNRQIAEQLAKKEGKKRKEKECERIVECLMFKFSVLVSCCLVFNV